MESFLSASKASLSKLSSYRRVRVVLGNESCDLDSAVSAVVQAFSEHLDAVKRNEEADVAVIPLLNIPEKEYRLKTEVVFFLKRHNVSSDLLTFRDQIDLKSLTKDGKIELQVVLVDHHSLRDEDDFLASSVVKIIDHRPRDARWPWPGREVHLETVGSCATLVARTFLDKHPEAMDRPLASLLRGPILIDTYNLSEVADRAKPADFEAVEALERAGLLDSDWLTEYKEIVGAKADISQLTVHDLLIRDLKVVCTVPIVVLPMLTRKFLELPAAYSAIGSFAESRGSTVVVLMGLDLSSLEISRDIGVYSLPDGQLGEKIVDDLVTSFDPYLELKIIKELGQGYSRLQLFDQANLRATRKDVLPIVRETMRLEGRC